MQFMEYVRAEKADYADMNPWYQAERWIIIRDYSIRELLHSRRDGIDIRFPHQIIFARELPGKRSRFNVLIEDLLKYRDNGEALADP